MSACVHWDVDQSMDPKSKRRTADFVSRYNGSKVRGVFMLGSDPIADQVGDVVVINRPAIPWGFKNASAAAAVLNQLTPGTITCAHPRPRPCLIGRTPDTTRARTL